VVTPRVLGRLPADLGYEPIADSGAGPDLASAPSRAPEAPIGTGVRRVPGGLRAARYLASSAPERLPRGAPRRAPYGERVDLSEALVAFSDKAHGRLKARLAGVEADELLWEPAPGCWSIRPAADGALAFDFGLGGTRMLPAITSSPVTTIAWRLAHIVDLLKEERCAKVLGLEPEPNAGELWLADRPEEALDYLDRAHDTWRGYLTRTDPDGWLQPVERWGNRVAFAHHILDEFVHHGAEIGVLRDLWRANHEASGLLAAVLEGDRDALRRAGDQAIAALRAERPGLLVEAASAGRWAAAQVLVELGFPSELPPGPSALHYAAGLGNLELVRSLVAAGANLDATDDKFNTTPLGWAEFIGGRLEAPGNPQASGANWPAVIDYLRSQPQP